MTIVRFEREDDIAAIRALNAEAFGRENEARIVDSLRGRGKLIVSLVAESQQRVVGHIAFSPVSIEHGEIRGVGLGPMCVMPAMQRQGIGSLLIDAGLRHCRELRFDFVVVLGHPRYYPRFGFVPASGFGIRCKWDVPDEVFMARELRQGALTGIEGVIAYEAEFDLA